MRFAFVVLFVAACTAGNTTSGGGGGGSASTGGGTSSGTGGSASTGGGSGATGGSSGTGGGTVAQNNANYACDVGPVLTARCLDCHSNPPRFGAPMPLVTYADTQAMSAQYAGQKIYQRIAARIVDPVVPMPQPPNAPLTAPQISAIQGWAAAGAPQGDSATCTVPDAGVMPDGGVPDSGYIDTPGCAAGDTLLNVIAPMTDIPQKSDYYECFAITVSLPSKRHAIKIDKVIDNAQVLHHVVLFRDTLKQSQAVELGCGIHASWQALYAWGPGAGPMIPPADVGLPINDGDQLVIQIHYNNPTSVMGTDSSGAYLCLTDQLRQNEAGVLAIGPTNFDLPPNCPAASVTGNCTNLANTTYNVFTVWPHMHVRGRAMLTTLKHSGAADQVVTDRPNYYFGAQYLENANFQLQHNDTLVNTCTWDTTGAPGDVKFGEATTDEMCFNFLYMYPPPPLPFCVWGTKTGATCN